MAYIQYVQLNSQVMVEDKYSIPVEFTTVAVNVGASSTERFQN